MQAIKTKYMPATNTRGSRIKATCERGSITIGYPHELSGEDCHWEAVKALCERFAREDVKNYGTPLGGNPWLREKVCGQVVGGEYVFVFTGK